MAVREYHLHGGKKGAALAIRVIPLASRDEIAGVLGDGTIRIRLKAAPVEGKENQALADFLAKILGVPKMNIEVVAGINGQDKLVSVLNMDPEEVQAKILQGTVSADH
jgi:uncharacterized protein (TIGR00251 family)